MNLITPSDHVHVPWKNGGGVSTTIADNRLPGFAPGDWSGIVWQLGKTTITTPAPFSDLSGFERLQVVVSGEGLFLDTPTDAIDLSRPYSVARFDGGTPTVSRLTAGPVGVVNLIARKDLARIDMHVLNPQDRRECASGRQIFHSPTSPSELVIDGRAIELSANHSICVDGAPDVQCRRGPVIHCTIAAV